MSAIIQTGDDLRRERLVRRLSLREAAALSGYTLAHLSDIECGRTRLVPRAALALAAALAGVPVHPDGAPPVDMRIRAGRRKQPV